MHSDKRASRIDEMITNLLRQGYPAVGTHENARTRPKYAIQGSHLLKTESEKLDSTWCQFLVKMIKGGFARKNAPPRESKKERATRQEYERLHPDEVENLNWGYKYNSSDILRTSKTTVIASFHEKQHMNFIAHLTRRENDEVQKVMCFATPRYGHRSHLLRLAKVGGIEQMYLQKTMYTTRLVSMSGFETGTKHALQTGKLPSHTKKQQ